MSKVLLSRQAEKKAVRIEKKYRQAIYEALLLISENPLAGKRLVGERSGEYSFRVGTYRIIYLFDSRTQSILVINIDHRKDIYR